MTQIVASIHNKIRLKLTKFLQESRFLVLPRGKVKVGDMQDFERLRRDALNLYSIELERP
jgi:hypothetical protein